MSREAEQPGSRRPASTHTSAGPTPPPEILDLEWLSHLRLVVFDLDGTLIDSLPQIHAAVNETRERYGGKQVSPNTVKSAIGRGARWLSRQLFSELIPGGNRADSTVDPDFERQLDQIHQVFIEIYAACSVDRLTPDSEIPWRTNARPLLDQIEALGMKNALLTNKPLALTEQILSATATSALFLEVRSPENSPAAKPDPRSLTDLIATCGVTKEESLFVGDSVVDFETGRRAGVATVGIRGGYLGEGEPPPLHWFEDPGQLGDWLAMRTVSPELREDSP